MNQEDVRKAHEINQKLGEIFYQKLNTSDLTSNGSYRSIHSWELKSETEDSMTFEIRYTEYGRFQSWEESSEELTISKKELEDA